jgi:hypothetical protein
VHARRSHDRRAFFAQAFRICPGFVVAAAIALRVSTLTGAQSASSW